MSTVLAIDTAAARLQLALLRPDGRLDTLVESMPQGQAERLFPALAELLDRNAASYGNLSRIAVTTGPGSFTGLRIGLAAARGLALALRIPVVGVPTLVALSLSAATTGPLAVYVDARRDEAYLQLFDAPGQPSGLLRLLPLAAAEAAIPAAAERIDGPFVDILALARFGARLDPADWPPEPVYGRSADAKPQDKARVARLGAA